MRFLFFVPVLLFAAEDAGRIMKPVDHASLRADQVEILATAPDAVLEVDGRKIDSQRPFPNVLQARPKLGNGQHTAAIVWGGGRKEIRFFVGPNAPTDYKVFHEHPPGGNTECTQCHELTKRGRFHFQGGCFGCHPRETFAKVHTHTPEVLSECGLCHNAHGSTVKAHLLYGKETACKQCHN